MQAIFNSEPCSGDALSENRVTQFIDRCRLRSRPRQWRIPSNRIPTSSGKANFQAEDVWEQGHLPRIYARRIRKAAKLLGYLLTLADRQRLFVLSLITIAQLQIFRDQFGQRFAKDSAFV